MQIKFLGTGSKGNSIAIITDSTTILIDIGIPKTKVEKLLIENDINPADIDAIFLTHSHKDHVQGLPMAEKWKIPVYASAGTWQGIPEHEAKYGYEGTSFKDPSTFELTPNLFISSFRTHHNDFDSYGYTVTGDDYKISVCLDTGHVSPDMIEAMQGSTHYIIEANHDVDMVTMSDYPDSVKARNLSDVGHLNNEQTAAALAQLVQGNEERIYLVHLSSKCNSPEMALYAVREAMIKKGFIRGTHYAMEVC